ncbi:thiol reductant ABC exporter subunit CydD [Mycolicibacterium sp. 018/SC-01/001]|uniref:thiol reductant ABC exporter subunit CydD n=1 Tax=Mycolicibacterium sp. 018/SC-01/001 TaxID=2592069 RepID=UPI00117EF2A9|nr:thiol reductant ABC exporter subunit CydD [Mycolicibacterium sp. 018/SC-01/001]TRW83389.1 thiol reductant ABC exporter subunit CydD [Mycolicibacterium sp. 018/SC-01/001]
MRRFLLTSTICGVVIAGATIGSAVVLAGLVARIITDPASRTVEVLAAPITLLAALWLVRVLTQWQQGRLAQHGASEVIADLTDQVLRKATTLPPRELNRRRDEAAAVVTRGLDGLRVYFTAYLPSLFLAVILTPATVAVIAIVDWQAAAIVLVALPLVPVFMILIGLATQDRSAAALAAMTTLQARLLDLVAGLPTLRAFGRAEGSTTKIAELGAAHRRSAMATMRIAFLSALVLELLATLGVALVAVSVGMRLVYGHIPLTAALTALLLAPEVFWPLRRVGAAFHSAQDGKTAVAAALAFLDSARPSRAGDRVLAGDAWTITADLPAMHAEPGRVTVLTGPNGCGKSTLLQAVLALDAAPEAHVRIDGVAVTDLDQQWWWSQVSWLAHRPVVIPGTVRENLELFGPLLDLDDACRAACFDTVLAELSDGLDTALGRDGVGLSLGQRQRLGLARALGSGARVLLLDEPTAHLDAAIEQVVLQAIRERAAAGATVVVVGHREAVLAIGDSVVEMGVAAHVGV